LSNSRALSNAFQTRLQKHAEEIATQINDPLNTSPEEREAFQQKYGASPVTAADVIRWMDANPDESGGMGEFIDTWQRVMESSGGGLSLEAAGIGQPVTGAGQIPAEAITALQQNDTPENRTSFDRTFGVGAAARVLGGR